MSMGDQARVSQTVAEFGEGEPGSTLPRRSDRLPLSICIWIWLGAGAALWTVVIYLLRHAAAWLFGP